MRQQFRVPGVAMVILAALALAGCSSKDSNPTAPGGGGSGGPNFNFTFPSVGSSNTATFPNAGSFSYRCTPHQGSGMTGTVVVTSGAAMLDTVEVGPNGTLTFSPSTVTIAPGGTVRWVRPATASLGNHTATR